MAAERADTHTYEIVSFYGDDLTLCIEGLKFYERLLEANVRVLKDDPDVKLILTEDVFNSLPLHRELSRVSRLREWLEQHRESGIFQNVRHGSIRLLKSAVFLYLQHLKDRRNVFASKPNISRYALEALDTRISQLEEIMYTGVFAQATPIPLLVDQVAQEQAAQAPDTTAGLHYVSRPRPVVISSIEILDSDLRARCLDLYQSFCEDGSAHRLDTVVSEATRILEDRIRRKAELPPDCVGVDLASKAFSGDPPILRLSDIENEQKAAHLLYRGVFGLIRNHVQHQLVTGLLPERVLQILVIVDYLLLLVNDSTRAS